MVLQMSSVRNSTSGYASRRTWHEQCGDIRRELAKVAVPWLFALSKYEFQLIVSPCYLGAEKQAHAAWFVRSLYKARR